MILQRLYLAQRVPSAEQSGDSAPDHDGCAGQNQAKHRLTDPADAKARLRIFANHFALAVPESKLSFPHFSKNCLLFDFVCGNKEDFHYQFDLVRQTPSHTLPCRPLVFPLRESGLGVEEQP
jgi:hypothetical protein